MNRLRLYILVLAMLPAVAAAQEPSAAESKREEAAPIAKDKAHRAASFKGGHPSFRFGALRLDVRGRVQADVRGSDGDGDDLGDLDLAHKRIGIEGEIGPLFTFEVEGEIRDAHPLRDALIEYRPQPSLRIRAGRFKLPFSLEATTSATDLEFAYRSQAATRLAPGRDRGVMLKGRLWRRRLMYDAGVFAHDGDKLREKGLDSTSGGPTAAGRISSVPFRSASVLGSAQVAVAFTASPLREGISRLGGRTAFGEPLFEPVYWVRGVRRRLGVETQWQPGPFSVSAEYLRLSDERRGQSLSGEDLSPLTASGWYAGGTWLVTGESKAPQVKPRRSIPKGGPGAIELAARVEALRFGDPAVAASGLPNPRAELVPGSVDRVVTAGINWYLTKSIKAQVNVAHEVIEGVTDSPRRVLSHVFRLQFTL